MYRVFHLIVLDEASDRYPFSGAENHLFVLLESLRQAGVAVELGLMLNRRGPIIESKIAELHTRGIPVHCFAYRRNIIDLQCIYDLRRFLKDRRDWIVHTHLDAADVVGKTAAWLADCRRVVSTVHNNELKHARPKWYYLIRLMDRLTRRHIAISHAVQRHLMELEKVDPGKIVVVPYGVPPPPASGDRRQLRARLNLPPESFVVGFVGRLTPQKNLPLLLQAMAQLPHMLCLLVGQGEQAEWLGGQAAGLANVRLLGHQPDAANLMPAFDVLCLPSQWEGLGLVLLEAMLRRVPIVGSRAGAIPEVLGEGRFGVLFDPASADDLARALRQVQEGGAPWVEEAYRYARAHFTVEAMTQKTLDVYRAVAA